MKRILRSLCTLLMLVVWASVGFAQEVTLDFTNAIDDWGISATATTKATKFTNGTYTIEASKGFKQQGKGVLLGKEGATLTLPAFDFDVEKIVVRKNTGTVSGRVTQNIFVGTQKVSTQTTGADKDQTYKIDAKYQAAGNIYVLKVTNANSTQFSKIEIYKAGPTKTATTLDFGFKTKSVNINETFTAPATLKTGETAISGAVTYTSSNSKVATVNKTTGEVSALVAGTTKITATYAGTSEYQGATAFYDLTVVDPNATEVTFDFTNPTTLGCSNIVTTNLKEGDKFVKEPISLTNKKNGSNTPNRLFKSTSGFYLGVYQEGQMELSAAEGYAITGISFTKEGKTLKINGALANEDWSGNAKSLILSVDAGKSGTKIKTMTVAYSKVSSIALDESQDNAETILGNADKTVNVKLTRTLKADVWNTFCVPFDVTVAGSPLEGATIKQIASVTEKDDGAVINFENAPATLEAGKAYLVRTATAIVNPTFNGVTVKNVDPTNCSGNEKYQLIGIYSPLNIDASLYGKVFGINNQDKLAKVKENTSIKGMRAYFLLANSATAAKLNFGGELTGIDAVDNGEAVMTGKVYNLNGQYVGNSLEGLKKGVYVVNGKKVLK